MTILKGLPIGYNRDLQEDKRIVFRAYDTVSSCLTMAAAIVNSAEFVKENIEPTLERGFLDATSLAEYLVTKGVAFRTAHQIVGSLVAKCERENKTALNQLSIQDFNEALAQSPDRKGGVGQAGAKPVADAPGSESASSAPQSRDREGAGRAQPVTVDEDVYNCLGAHNVVQRYQSAGAAGGKPFEEQLKAWKERLGM
jgi:argininosuccinate lyase